jgi:hypothetical protein
MPKTRVSVTIERALLDELKKAAGQEIKLSELFSDAIRDEIRRLGMLALLDEWERENPSSPEDIEAGERLWQRLQSSWTPECLQRSQKKGPRSGRRSSKR